MSAGSKTHRIRWFEGGRGRGDLQRRTGLGDAVGGDKAWEKPCGSECGQTVIADTAGGAKKAGNREPICGAVSMRRGQRPGSSRDSSERAAGERGSAKISRQKLTP